jgi:hypothetical protein
MTTRYQSLRSSISGNLPAAGTRLPGELWVNFPDLQLGLIDASKTAQKLIAVRYFSTTATYAAGDVVVQAGALYVANGAVPPGAFTAAQWTKVSTATDLAGYLALAGGTMTGPIISVTGDSINGAAGTARSLFGTTAASKRWELQLGGPSAEGGSNAGSNFNLIAYNDAGAVLSTPMSIARATGAVTFGSSVSIPSLTLTALDNTPIGQTTPASGAFTTLTSTGGALNGSLGATTPAAASVTSLNGGQLAGMRNKIINGAMDIDQRNNFAAIASIAHNTVVADRWKFLGPPVGKFNAQTVVSGAGSFAHYLSFWVASAYTPLAGDYLQALHAIEGLNIIDLMWGTASAIPVTLSFWLGSSITGTHSGVISNGNSTRCYPFTFSVPTANTLTKIAITIPGDTAGTWAQDNTAALTVHFNLGSGSTYLGAPGAWSGNNYVGATGSVQVVTSASGNFNFTGVQLEPGSVATPFERRLYGAELALCQRYYQRYTSPNLAGAFNFMGAGVTAGGNLSWPIPMVASMRAAPTPTLIGTWSLSNCTGASIGSSPNTATFAVSGVATGFAQAYSPANGGLDLSAEV